MTEQQGYRRPFKDAIGVPIHDLPDHLVQNINDLTNKILVAACTDENRQFIDSNLSLAAMQKALGLLIAKFFPKDKIPEITEIISKALAHNAKEWMDI